MVALSRTLACAVFLSGFAFSHLKIIGNYNFVCPYSHELTHGIAFSLFTLALLTSGGFGSKWKVTAAGLLWGFVFLGKPEVFLALSGTQQFCLALGSWSARCHGNKRAPRAFSFWRVARLLFC